MRRGSENIITGLLKNSIYVQLNVLYISVEATTATQYPNKTKLQLHIVFGLSNLWKLQMKIFRIYSESVLLFSKNETSNFGCTYSYLFYSFIIVVLYDVYPFFRNQFYGRVYAQKFLNILFHWTFPIALEYDNDVPSA